MNNMTAWDLNLILEQTLDQSNLIADLKNDDLIKDFFVDLTNPNLVLGVCLFFILSTFIIIGFFASYFYFNFQKEEAKIKQKESFAKMIKLVLGSEVTDDLKNQLKHRVRAAEIEMEDK